MTKPEANEEIDDLFLDDEDTSAGDDEVAATEGGADADESPSTDDDDELDALFIEDDDGDAAGEVAEVGGDSARIAELEAELEAAQTLAAANHERLVRKAADLENARRRHQREKDDMTKYAAESVLKDIVPVLDDLQRAIDHWSAGQEDAGETLIEGLQMVTRKFEQTLARRGVQAVESTGKPFDPQFHEAIQQKDDETVPHNTVVQEFQRGYVIHDRLLRPALVVVAQGGPAAVEETSEAEAAEEANTDVAEAANVDEDSSEATEVADVDAPVDADDGDESETVEETDGES